MRLRRELKAAIALQSLCRSWLAHLVMYSEVWSASATVIQARWRGVRARQRVLHAIRVEVQQLEATTTAGQLDMQMTIQGRQDSVKRLLEDGGPLTVHFVTGKRKHRRMFWVSTSHGTISWDKEKSPEPSRTELLQSVQSAPVIKGAQEWFDSIAGDGSGYLDGAGLSLLYTQATGETLGKQQLRAAMKTMDLDDSGSIEYGAFERWWKTNGGDLESHREQAFTVVTATSQLLLVADDSRTKAMWVDGLNQAIQSKQAADAVTFLDRLDKAEAEATARVVQQQEMMAATEALHALEMREVVVDMSPRLMPGLPPLPPLIHSDHGIEDHEMEELAAQLIQVEWRQRQAARANHTFIKEQRKQLRAAFDDFDTSGDGALDIEEVGKLLTLLGKSFTEDELRAQMAILDADGSGHLDYAEFFDLILNMHSESEESESPAESETPGPPAGNSLSPPVAEPVAEPLSQPTEAPAEVTRPSISALDDEIAALRSEHAAQQQLIDDTRELAVRVIQGKSRQRRIARADHAFTKEHGPELRAAFDAADTSGDGTLDIEEVGELLKSLGKEFTEDELQAQMSALDADGNGNLDFAESYDLILNVLAAKSKVEAVPERLMPPLPPLPPLIQSDRDIQELAAQLIQVEWRQRRASGAVKQEREKLRAAFNAVDTSGDGTLDIEEVGELLTSLGKEFTDDELRAQVAVLDADGSGHLDFAEFFDMILNMHMGATEEVDDTGSATAQSQVPGTPAVSAVGREAPHATSPEPRQIHVVVEPTLQHKDAAAEAAREVRSEEQAGLSAEEKHKPVSPSARASDLGASPHDLQERKAIAERSQQALGTSILDLRAWSTKLVDTARDCAIYDRTADGTSGGQDRAWARVQELVLPSIEVRGTSNYAPAVMPPEGLNALPEDREFNMLHWVCLSCAKGVDDSAEVKLLEALLEAGAELDTSVRSGTGTSLQPAVRNRTARELLSTASATSWDGSKLDPMLAALYKDDHAALLQALDKFDEAQGRPPSTRVETESARPVREAKRGAPRHVEQASEVMAHFTAAEPLVVRDQPPQLPTLLLPSAQDEPVVHSLGPAPARRRRSLDDLQLGPQRHHTMLQHDHLRAPLADRLRLKGDGSPRSPRSPRSARPAHWSSSSSEEEED